MEAKRSRLRKSKKHAKKRTKIKKIMKKSIYESYGKHGKQFNDAKNEVMSENASI